VRVCCCVLLWSALNNAFLCGCGVWRGVFYGPTPRCGLSLIPHSLFGLPGPV
jgi:hypothetical protein